MWLAICSVDQLISMRPPEGSPVQYNHYHETDRSFGPVNDFVSGEACFCNTDLCNSAPKMGAIFGLLIVPILIIVTLLWRNLKALT